MTEQTDAAEVEGILALAAEIRRVDGNHDLGAAALAEALWPFVAAAEARGAERALREAAEEIQRTQAAYTPNGFAHWLRDRATQVAPSRVPGGGIVSGEPRTCTPYCGCDPAVVKLCLCGYREPSRVPSTSEGEGA